MPRHRLIDAFLDRLRRAVAEESERKQRILEEVRDHLITAVEEDVGRGYSRAEAEERAVARFGRPESIAAQFALADAPRLASPPSPDRTRRCRDGKPNTRRLVVSENTRNGKTVSDGCSFCGKPHAMGANLTNGQNGVAICDACLRLCTEIISRERDQATSSAGTIGRRERRRGAIYHCSFCGREHADVERLIAGPNFVFVCNRCVDKFTETLSVGTPTP